jgi:hypothetical protein
VSPRVEHLADSVSLWLADCRDVPPAMIAADQVMTDPPYEDELYAAVGRIRRHDGRNMVRDLGFDGVNDERADTRLGISSRCSRDRWVNAHLRWATCGPSVNASPAGGSLQKTRGAP